MNYLSKSVISIVMLLMTLSCMPIAVYADQHYDFTYPDRTSLIAAGWDFLAVTPSGGVRNTEQTSGAVVSYDQTAHPGVLRIPADVGDLWDSTNNSRNTLFRGLPSDWTSIRLKIAAWGPTQNYQQAELLAYQDDDNYVGISRIFANGNCLEFVNETQGSGGIDTLSIESTATDLYLRLDRDPSTNIITGSYSFTGDSWILVGSVTQALNSPQLGIFIGASPGGFPNADLQWAEVASGTAPAGAALSLYPGNLVFSSNEGTVNTSGQTVNVIYGSPSTTQWTQTSNAPWLITSPGSGSTAQGSPGSFSVSVDPTGLAPGVHTGTITVSSPDANNSPQTVNVDLVVKQNPAVQVTTWKDAHPGAMSVWVDDGDSSCLTELQSAGFDGTYVANGTLPDFYPSYYNAGMELGSHLFYHNCFAMDEYYLRFTEIEPNINEICANTPEPCQDVISLAWPCGFTTVEEEAVASDYYLSSRGYNFNLLEGTTPTDWMNLKSFNSHEHTPYPPADLKTVVDMAVQQGLWANLVFHTSCDDDNAIAYAATQDIWVAPAGSVVKYIWQRNAFILQSYQATSDTTTFSYSRLGIPPSPFRSFETAFGPGDLITLQVLINGVTQVSSVTLDGTSYPYTASTSNGNTIVLIDAPIDTTTRTIIVTADPAPPTIAFSPTSLTFSTPVGTNPANQPIALSNSGGGTLNWTATADTTSPQWLSVGPGSGTGNATLTASVNVAGLTAGTYTKAITITAPGSTNTPQTVNVTLTVGATKYTITATAGSGGSISPSGATTVNSGGSQTYTITPSSGYSISNVQVDGSSVGPVSSYTFSNVTATHTISATFATTKYTITATAGSGGSISPYGATKVNSGGSQTYTITPTSGYSISGVQVDGTSVGAVSSYTFSNVTATHTISATFATGTTQTPVFATNSGGGQYTSPSSGIVYQADTDYSGGTAASTTAAITGTSDPTLYKSERYGNFSYNIPLANGNYTVTFKFAEIYWNAAGERIFNVSMQGTQVISNLDIYVQAGKNAAYDVSFPVSVTNGTLNINFTSVIDYAKVSAILITSSDSTTTYTITATAGQGGSISPSGTTKVNSGGSQTYTITPSSGYSISGVQVDGTPVGAVSSYTFSNVTATHTISATFAVTTYTITATAGSGGSISPSGTTKVNSGGSQTYTITPSSGYSISGVQVDGTPVGAVSSYTFSNVTATHTISATFATTTYTITATAGSGGSISPSGTTKVNSGGSQTYTITPSSGYSISGVQVDGTPVGAVSSYTFSNVTATHTISATFATTTYTITATAGSGGSISPSGTTKVNSGGSQTYTITPSSGYSISGVQVDGTPVGAVSSYTFSNVTANHTIAATFATGTQTSSFATNSGGGQYTSQSSGIVYQADTDYSGGTAASTTAAITGTSDPALYQSERYGNFSYNIPLANGNYTVTLKFAEIYWTAAGKRVFNVSMQGTQVISNLDIYSKAGKNAAYDVTIPVSVTNGILNIAFTTVVDNAKVSAIVVTPPATSTSFADNAGGGQYTSPSSGIVYQADTDYSGGTAASTTAAITGTPDPTLYQSERYGNFSYNIPLANGNYNVTLKFAEIYWTAAGKRVFNVSMQGTKVISNLDIYSKAGKNAAYDVTIPVSVTNGMLNISFTSVTDYAKVSAIGVTSN